MKGFSFGSSSQREKSSSVEFYVDANIENGSQSPSSTSTGGQRSPDGSNNSSSIKSSGEILTTMNGIKSDKVDKSTQTDPPIPLESIDIEVNCLSLFVFASEHKIDQLMKQCSEHMKTKLIISESNFDQVLSVASNYNSYDLLKILVQYLSVNFTNDTIDGSQVLTTTNDQQNSKDFGLDILQFIKENGDVRLISKDEQIVMCHSLFLRSRSSVFKRMLHLELNWKEGQRSEIFIHDFNSDVLEEFVTFLVTDSVNQLDKHAIELLFLSDKYSVPKLGIKCINYISSNINKFNLFDVIKAAKRTNSNKLVYSVLNKLQTDHSQ